MKTTKIIIAAALTLSSGILFAGNDLISANSVTGNSTLTLPAVAPTTPMEATFEDFAIMTEFSGLVPVTPAEATFEDFSDVNELAGLAPVTPDVADFE